MRVSIRRIGLVSLSKLGCLLGTVAALLPSLLFGLALVAVLQELHHWLKSWQSISLNLWGQDVTQIDLVRLLGLENVLIQLQVFGGLSLPVLLLTVMVLALLSGILVAFTVLVVGLTYNLLASATGGLTIELVATSEADDQTHDTP